MTEKHYDMEETDQVEQAEHGVNKLILLIAGILVLVCIIYFFTHLTRPA